MKPWIKKKRAKVGFSNYGFTLCAICTAGVTLHKEHSPPVISCGDAHTAGKNSLFTVQDLPHLCPREIKKQKIASRAERGVKRKMIRIATC